MQHCRRKAHKVQKEVSIHERACPIGVSTGRSEISVDLLGGVGIRLLVGGSLLLLLLRILLGSRVVSLAGLLLDLAELSLVGSDTVIGVAEAGPDEEEEVDDGQDPRFC